MFEETLGQVSIEDLSLFWKYIEAKRKCALQVKKKKVKFLFFAMLFFLLL